MAKVFEQLYWALTLSIILAVMVMVGLHGDMIGDANLNGGLIINLVVWVHVVMGVLWIGLLWYLNIVQVPTMPKIPAELKPAISKYIAPEVLFWFRWSALLTMLTGLKVAYLKGYLVDALTFASNGTIGLGMWMGLIMAFNVWVLIWPNQKKVLGIVPADDAAKAKAGRIALLASRTNFILSLPMLYCMVSQNIIG
jgi:uncharacterized membrane protein